MHENMNKLVTLSDYHLIEHEIEALIDTHNSELWKKII